MSASGGDGVRDAADLARLPPPDDDVLDACRRVVAAFSGLPETTGPPRPAHHAAGVRDVLRDDEPVPSLPTDDVLHAAPDAVDGAFRVPRVRDVR